MYMNTFKLTQRAGGVCISARTPQRPKQTLGFDAPTATNDASVHRCPHIKQALIFSWLFNPRARFNLSDIVIPTALGTMVALGGIRELACAQLNHVNVLPVITDC